MASTTCKSSSKSSRTASSDLSTVNSASLSNVWTVTGYNARQCRVDVRLRKQRAVSTLGEIKQEWLDQRQENNREIRAVRFVSSLLKGNVRVKEAMQVLQRHSNWEYCWQRGNRRSEAMWCLQARPLLHYWQNVKCSETEDVLHEVKAPQWPTLTQMVTRRILVQTRRSTQCLQEGSHVHWHHWKNPCQWSDGGGVHWKVWKRTQACNHLRRDWWLGWNERMATGCK